MRRTRGFWMVTGLVLVLVALMSASLAVDARAKTIVALPRPGQVGVGVSGLYGTLMKGGEVGSQFGSGPGLAVRLRYRMRYERGFGVVWENHGCDVRPGDFRDLVIPDSIYPAGSAYATKRVNLFLYGVDFYQLFGTRTKTTRMLSVGGGIAHPIVKLYGGEVQYPWSDGLYLSAGAGVERFFWQGLAWDLGARYQAVFLNGKTNHDFQVSAGVIFYPSL
jgi:hypothetical protein